MPTDPAPAWVLSRRRAIGDALRAARNRAELTQEGLGDRVGLDRRTISNFEHAESDPTLSNLLRLASALGVSLADLVRE